MPSKAILLMAALSTVALAQDATTLRIKLETGDEFKYDMTIVGKNSFEGPMGAMEMTSNGSMRWTMKVGAANEGLNDVEILVSNLKMNVTTPVGEQDVSGQMPAEIKATAKIDPRGRMSDYKLITQVPGMSLMPGSNVGSSATTFIEFPEGPVKPGDSWNVTWPANPMYSDKESILKATFVEIKDAKYVISLVGEVPMSVDSSKMPESPSPVPFTMTGKMNVKAEYVVNPANGRMLESTTSVVVNATMETAGQQLPIKGDSKVVMKAVSGS